MQNRTATTARSAMAFEESARRSGDAKIRSYCMGRSSGLMGKLFTTMKMHDDEELNDICESYSKRDDISDE